VDRIILWLFLISLFAGYAQSESDDFWQHLFNRLKREMKYTLKDIAYNPRVGALDRNGTVHFEVDITEDSVSLHPTAYNVSNGMIERISDADPIFVYNYNTTVFTDSNHETSLSVPQDE
tara:strand:+ start:138 stop:494 length:357 start_codon:yes stop_codon:yes gene_type:complete